MHLCSHTNATLHSAQPQVQGKPIDTSFHEECCDCYVGSSNRDAGRCGSVAPRLSCLSRSPACVSAPDTTVLNMAAARQWSVARDLNDVCAAPAAGAALLGGRAAAAAARRLASRLTTSVGGGVGEVRLPGARPGEGACGPGVGLG